MLLWAQTRTDREPYPRDNWRKGTDWLEFIGSTLRHVTAWKDGEDVDHESGLNHLHHAACDLMFVIEYIERGLGNDDRFRYPKGDGE